MSKFGNLGGALKYAYSHIEWDLSKFSLLGKKSEQRKVKAKIEALLPETEIIENYQHPELNWGTRLMQPIFFLSHFKTNLSALSNWIFGFRNTPLVSNTKVTTSSLLFASFFVIF